MTWLELALHLLTLTEEQVHTDVTIYDAEEDEFFSAGELGFAKDEAGNPAADILDERHPYLIIKREP